MDRIVIRNFSLFLCLLVFCTAVLIYTLIIGNKAIERIDRRVLHTHDVITAAEQLSATVEGALAAQRGYIITGQKNFYDDYQRQKGDITRNLVRLSELTSDNASQRSRLQKMRDYNTK